MSGSYERSGSNATSLPDAKELNSCHADGELDH
jgi:hypothetical protein